MQVSCVSINMHAAYPRSVQFDKAGMFAEFLQATPFGSRTTQNPGQDQNNTRTQATTHEHDSDVELADDSGMLLINAALNAPTDEVCRVHTCSLNHHTRQCQCEGEACTLRTFHTQHQSDLCTDPVYWRELSTPVWQTAHIGPPNG